MSSGPALDTYRWGQEIPLLERLIFSRRALWLALFALLTVALGWQASKLQPDASFEKMIPQQHPYVQAMMKAHRGPRCGGYHHPDRGRGAAGGYFRCAVPGTVA